MKWTPTTRFRLALRRPRQRLLPALERRARIERGFRWGTIAVTVATLAAVWAAFPTGRAALQDWAVATRFAAGRRIGLPADRAEVEAYWKGRRARHVAETRERYRRKFAELPANHQSLLRTIGMAPDDAVVRWGNYDMALVFPSNVIEADDQGRQYRLRPDVRSAWFRQVFGFESGQLLLPLTPEVLRAAEAVGAERVAGSEQSTNSWGCRGAEADSSAPVRGIVLGDSFMQGLMIGDDETPPARLEHHLRAALGRNVSVLNTGHLGYCPEHYYQTLRAYLRRFRPTFVVVGYYANDFGEEPAVFTGNGDWAEGCYWLERIEQECRGVGALCLFAPVPAETLLRSARGAGGYPQRVSEILKVSGPLFCDPTDSFVNEDLKVRRTEGWAGAKSPLYNGRIADGHLSRRGADLWGRVVAKRLALLLNDRADWPMSARRANDEDEIDDCGWIRSPARRDGIGFRRDVRRGFTSPYVPAYCPLPTAYRELARRAVAEDPSIDPGCSVRFRARRRARTGR